jgi:RIO kinase 1
LSTRQTRIDLTGASNDLEYYEQLFDPELAENPVRTAKRKSPRTYKKSKEQQLAELTDEAVGLEGGFQTTYKPARYEAGWLLESLRSFYDLDLVTDVLSQVKGGKEANVYRCQANPATGVEFLAAKVYRPRKFRNLRNDKMYREGRAILTGDGKPVKKNEHRLMRAINKKTDFGQSVAHTSWLMHEFTTLRTLHALGLPVPAPLAAAENALLMGYIGDDRRAAPTLHETSLPLATAKVLFITVMDAIERMLQNGLIHGDLSAYNILYWEGAITIIDFPQVIDSQANSQSRFILSRDIQRVCDYFSLQGVPTHAKAITEEMWERYMAVNANNLLADLSRDQEPEE